MSLVLFATPPVSRAERYGRLAGAGSSAPSLGLLMLAAAARQAGFAPAVIDAAALEMPLEEFAGRLRQLRPSVLGLSATTLTIAGAAVVAEAVRRLFPDCRILVGGPHVSALPVETLERFPVFDFAVVGEGEQTVVELLQAFAANRTPQEVKGIACRDGDRVLLTPPRPFMRDLDRLPRPAWDLLEGFPQRYAPPAFKTKQLPAASLVTSRGCPNRCIFCDRSVFGSSCHAYSAAYVVEMLRELRERFGVREVSFEDDTFVTFRPRLKEICARLIEERLGLSWSCLGRVNQVTAETLALMRRAGCWQISFGIESGAQEVLDLIRKDVTLEQIRRAVQMSRQAGLRTRGFFIVGHPGETRETLRRTIEFALELPLDDISVSLLTPFPGTELCARAGEFGAFDPDWRRMNLLNPVFVPFGLSAGALLEAQSELLRRFYLRPGRLLDYAGRLARHPSLALPLARGACSLLRTVRHG
jgi:radical SAM superfamily enzyme YgiQ (UPF0313 family)